MRRLGLKFCMKRLYLFFIIAITLKSGGTLFSQINYPLISPPCTLQQTVGLTDIQIAYHKPGARGRSIFGSLVPFDRIWRVGANESTKISFSDSVYIKGQLLPKGTYALYAIPQPHQWTIIFHTNITHWGDGRNQYRPEEDALRITAIPDTQFYHSEDLQLYFENISFEKAHLVIHWERTKVSIPIAFPIHTKMLQEIAYQIKNNPTADTYYQSGRYLKEAGLLPQVARNYLMKANDLNPNKYYIHRVWAEVEGQLKNYEKAIELARISAQLAEKEGKDEFVSMNERSIHYWNSLLQQKN